MLSFCCLLHMLYTCSVRQSILDLQLIISVEFTKISDLGPPPVHSVCYSMLSPKETRGIAAKKASFVSNRKAPEKLGTYLDGEGGNSFFSAPIGEMYTKQPFWEESLEVSATAQLCAMQHLCFPSS